MTSDDVESQAPTVIEKSDEDKARGSSIVKDSVAIDGGKDAWMIIAAS